MLTTIIILKPNKMSYISSKLFRLIVLLNTLGKLIKKFIGDRLQYLTTSSTRVNLGGSSSNQPLTPISLSPISFTWGGSGISLQALLYLTFPNSSYHSTTAYLSSYWKKLVLIQESSNSFQITSLVGELSIFGIVFLHHFLMLTLE